MIMNYFSNYGEWRKSCTNRGYTISRLGWKGGYSACDDNGKVVGQWLPIAETLESVDFGWVELP